MPLAAPVTSATRVSRSELLMSLGRYPLRHPLQAGGVPGRLLRWMCAVPPAARRAEVAESVDAHDSGTQNPPNNYITCRTAFLVLRIETTTASHVSTISMVLLHNPTALHA